MKIQQIEELLNKKVGLYAKRLESDVIYKSGKNITDFHIPLKRCEIIFKLTKKEKLLSPVGTLYCQVSIGKTETEVYYLHEIVTLLNSNDFRATFLSYLYDEERLERAFNFLTGILDDYTEQINDLISDKELREKLAENRLSDIKKSYNISEEEIHNLEEDNSMKWWNNAIGDVYIQRYTQYIAYQRFIQGKYDKMLKKYGRLISKGKELTYERNLYEYVKKNRDNIAEIYPGGSTEFIAGVEKPSEIFMLMAAPFVFMSVAMIILLMCINYFFYKNTLYVDGMKWYMAVIFAGMPAMFMGISLRKKQYKLFRKKELEELDKLKDSKTENKFVNIATVICIIISLVVLINIDLSANRLYEDYLIIDGSEKLLSHQYEKYYYKNIAKVYYIRGRYNDFDEYIKRPSYVLVFEDGKQIDTDLWAGSNKMKNTVLPIMKVDLNSIIEVRSERDIKE